MTTYEFLKQKTDVIEANGRDQHSLWQICLDLEELAHEMAPLCTEEAAQLSPPLSRLVFLQANILLFEVLTDDKELFGHQGRLYWLAKQMLPNQDACEQFRNRLTYVEHIISQLVALTENDGSVSAEETQNLYTAIQLIPSPKYSP